MHEISFLEANLTTLSIEVNISRLFALDGYPNFTF